MISKITVEDVAKYLRLSEIDEDEKKELTNLIKIAKDYIKSYTGLSNDKLDEHESFDIVLFILCQDMYDNRTYYVDSKNANKTVETILGMHSINLL